MAEKILNVNPVLYIPIRESPSLNIAACRGASRRVVTEPLTEHHYSGDKLREEFQGKPRGADLNILEHFLHSVTDLQDSDARIWIGEASNAISMIVNHRVILKLDPHSKDDGNSANGKC